MKIAIIILLIVGMLDWKINDEKYPIIRLLFNVATLVCFIIYSR